MESFKRPQICSTKSLKNPNIYCLALQNEICDFAFDEEQAPLYKGQWRIEVFKDPLSPLDLEIGTGNGYYFHHHLLKNPNRNLIGMELKYKPLVQTIRRALKSHLLNGRVIRAHAFNIDTIFSSAEINNIFVHFPDPWVRPLKPRHRLLNPRMLDILWEIQLHNSFLEFKTDSKEYFLWAKESIISSKYKIEIETADLHNSEWSQNNFTTSFEKIFIAQKLPIFYLKLRKS